MTAQRSRRPQRPWRVDATRLVYYQPPWFQIWEEDITLPTGTTVSRYVIMEMRESILVFALTEDDRVILVEQYRHGIAKAELGLPAGYIETDDPFPLARAQQELREETGYMAREWEPLGGFVIDPNRTKARYFYFLARGCHPGAQRRLEDAEVDLAVRLVPLADIQDWPTFMAENNPTLPTVAGLLLGLKALARG